MRICRGAQVGKYTNWRRESKSRGKWRNIVEETGPTKGIDIARVNISTINQIFLLEYHLIIGFPQIPALPTKIHREIIGSLN